MASFVVNYFQPSTPYQKSLKVAFSPFLRGLEALLGTLFLGCDRFDFQLEVALLCAKVASHHNTDCGDIASIQLLLPLGLSPSKCGLKIFPWQVYLLRALPFGFGIIFTLPPLQVVIGPKFGLPTEPGLLPPIVFPLTILSILQNQSIQLSIAFAKADL